MGRVGLIAFAMLGVAGCLAPDLVVCADGRACAAGSTCNDELHTCTTAEQVAACDGYVAGDACQLEAGTGTCIEGACFIATCGDLVIEPGEACDDGNFFGGDGCSADCRTSELCGDGTFEPALGEACDDGNLVSGDGCDSRCAIETLTWKVRQCGTPHPRPGFAVFDVRRNLVVAYDTGWMWEWDGAAWACTPIEPQPSDFPFGPPIQGLAYDPVRQRVLVFETARVRAWDETGWTTVVDEPVPNFVAIAYDSSVDRFWAWDTNYADKVMYWDPVTFMWSTVSPPSPQPAGFLMRVAYDPTADRIVGVSDQADTWVWNRTAATWTKITPATRCPDGATIVYSPARGKVVSFGGQLVPDTATSNVYEWTGSTWSLIVTDDDPLLPRYDAPVVYDPSVALIVVGGYVPNAEIPTDVYRLTDSWTRWAPSGLMPGNIASIASFPPERAFIAVTDTGETWRFDGSTWTPIKTEQPGPTKLVYRPDTQRLVGYDSTGRLAELQGTEWVTVAMDTGTIPIPEALAYDPARTTLMLFDDSQTYLRQAGGWVALPATILRFTPSLSYDYRNDVMTLVSSLGPDSTVHALVADAWRDTFSFGPGISNFNYYFSAELAQRGTVMYVARSTNELWENINDTWHRYTSPHLGTVTATAYDPVTAELVLLDPYTHRVTSAGWQSGTPRESCVDKDDLDGDGASGCDDQDCWWRCAPTCPPYASCP